MTARPFAAFTHMKAFARNVWAEMEPLFRAGLPRMPVPSVMLEHLPATDDDMMRMAAFSGPLRIELASTACLERSFALPGAVRAEAEQAVILQLRTSLPHGGRGLIWRAYAAGEGEGRLLWRALIVKETHITDFLARAKRVGLNIRDIRIAKLHVPPIWQADPVPPRSARNWAAATFLGISLVTLAAALVVNSHATDLSDLLREREKRVQSLNDRLAQLEADRINQEDQGNAWAHQWEAYKGGARPLVWLTAVAEALPADVWLSELTVTGEDWRLSGFTAGDIATIVVALQALPGMNDVRLDGPIQQDSFSGRSRFDLTMKLRAVAAP